MRAVSHHQGIIASIGRGREGPTAVGNGGTDAHKAVVGPCALLLLLVGRWCVEIAATASSGAEGSRPAFAPCAPAHSSSSGATQRPRARMPNAAVLSIHAAHFAMISLCRLNADKG